MLCERPDAEVNETYASNPEPSEETGDNQQYEEDEEYSPNSKNI